PTRTRLWRAQLLQPRCCRTARMVSATCRSLQLPLQPPLRPLQLVLLLARRHLGHVHPQGCSLVAPQPAAAAAAAAAAAIATCSFASPMHPTALVTLRPPPPLRQRVTRPPVPTGRTVPPAPHRSSSRCR